MSASADFLRAVFVVAALALAGCAHVIWLRSATAKRWRAPLDCGLTLRGRRLFGANKTVGGLAVMPIAAAVAFPLLAGLLGATLPHWRSTLWPLSAAELALLGYASGLAFMLAELPNSLLKRQFDVAPGQLPAQPWLKPLCALADRLDSTIGVLLLLTVTVGATAYLWLWAIVLGPTLHAAFSAWLYRAGVKARAL
jgi:hypothetical protein